MNTPDRTRTCNLLLRRQPRCPIAPRVQSCVFFSWGGFPYPIEIPGAPRIYLSYGGNHDRQEAG